MAEEGTIFEFALDNAIKSSRAFPIEPRNKDITFDNPRLVERSLL